MGGFTQICPRCGNQHPYTSPCPKKEVPSMRKLIIGAIAVASLAACATDADVASENLSKASEQFEISRRITVINGITDKVLMVVEGKCSMEYPDNRTEIVCKLADGTKIKNVLRQSDNVTVLMEQTTGTAVDTKQYRVIFKPESLVPNFDRPAK